MHTRLKKPRSQRVKPPTPIAPPVPPRPKRRRLKHIYKDLITTNRDQRVETLKKALHWYEELLAHFSYQKKFTLKQKRLLSKAQKHRLTGLKSDKDVVKEDHYVYAIKDYEQVCRSYKAPKIGAFISKYSRVRHKLEGRHRRMDHKFGEYLELIGNILRPINYKGKRISMDVDKLTEEYRIDSEGNVTFDRKFLEKSKRASRRDGLLAGFLILFPVLTKAAGQHMEIDSHGHRTGKYMLSGRKRYIALFAMIERLKEYALTTESAKRLVRRHKVCASDATTSAA